MKLTDFDYHISQEQIAQHPLKERDSSRLFVVHRGLNKFEHRMFRDIVSYLGTGDVLVINDTRVIPSRLFGAKPSGGKVEIMLLRELEVNIWEALVKGAQEGRVILKGDIIAHVSRGSLVSSRVTFEFGREADSGVSDIKNYLHEIGVTPLPPYIKRDAVKSDLAHYQTVYADKEGAVAAPTAGLHFTGSLLDSIKRKGVDVRPLTLHVGYGTFKPVTVHNIAEHEMDEESYEVPEATAHAINRAKAEGRRVIAVGTTVTRALESAAINSPGVNPGFGRASIFIYPGYRFKIIDVLVTNFHQPKSTPIMLTSAFAGFELLRKAYPEAMQEGYRFFSYGDAMLVL